MDSDYLPALLDRYQALLRHIICDMHYIICDVFCIFAMCFVTRDAHLADV